jgi:hypothetical protein
VQVVGLREMACFQELLGCAERTAEGGCPTCFLVVENYREKKFGISRKGCFLVRVILGRSVDVERYPPSSTPRKALTSAGFAKMVCKILSPKGLEVRILITSELRHYSPYGFYTASALTMICSLSFWVKVGRHIGVRKSRVGSESVA